MMRGKLCEPFVTVMSLFYSIVKATFHDIDTDSSDTPTSLRPTRTRDFLAMIVARMYICIRRVGDDVVIGVVECGL